MEDDLISFVIALCVVLCVGVCYSVFIQLIIARTPIVMLFVFLVVAITAQSNRRPWNPLRRPFELLPS